MAWMGSCNRCGHCGCYEGAGGASKWYPGIGGSHMAWGRQHPDMDLDVCAHIRMAFQAKFGHEWDDDYGFEVDVRFVGGGQPINATIYVSEHGIQKSATDRSCPFFVLGTPNECLLYERPQYPPACQNTPMNLTTTEEATKWTVDHPTCGYYWVD